MSVRDPQNQKLRILVVEDEPISAALMRNHFESEGFRVDVATDGNMALEMHDREPYRVVVSDWYMPGMDGLSLCRELRGRSGNHVYFILCSGRSISEGRKRAFEAGVDDFLTKPINRDELVPRMKAARRILLTQDDLEDQRAELQTTSLELREMSASLTDSVKRFHSLFEGLPVACFTIDEDDHIRDWNASAETVFGLDMNEVIGLRATKLLTSETAKPWPGRTVRKLMYQNSFGSFEWEFERNGQVISLTTNIITMQEDGQMRGAICASVDVTARRRAEQVSQYAQTLEVQTVELEAANRELNQLAITDGLTGLWNHRRFHEVLATRVSECEKVAVPLSRILLDIDHFKRVNDRLGHQEGDQVLKAFALALRDNSREAEAPFRYGGEEFAILLRNCDEQRAVDAALRFSLMIRRTEWKHWPMTASFGIATAREGSTAKSMVSEADHALYAAKNAGRNRVAHYNRLDELRANTDAELA